MSPAFAERSKCNGRPMVYTDGKTIRYGIKLGARRSQYLISTIHHLLDKDTLDRLSPVLDREVMSASDAARLAGKISADRTRLSPAAKRQSPRDANKRYHRKHYVPHPRDYSKQKRGRNGKFCK